MTEKQAQTIELSDGRTLGFAEYGDPDGQPIFFMHGGNDSRLAGALLASGATELGVRLIAPDRPGFGLSTAKPDRTLLGWPNDVAELAQALKIDRFSVIGHSAGGPHALVTAIALPERVNAAATVASAGPPAAKDDRPFSPFKLFWKIGTVYPNVYRPLLKDQRKQLDNAEKFLKQWGMMSKADGRVFARPDIADAVVGEMREGYRNGAEGMIAEMKLVISNWPFEIDQVLVPLHVWYGSKDVMAAPGWSHYIASTAPNATFHGVADEGHFSLLINHHHAILKSVLDETQV